MRENSISIWGDSIGKCIMFDADRNRHVICRDSYETCLKQKGMEIKNYAVMGCTAPKGESLMTDERMRRGGLAVIEFGGNDSDLDWKAVCDDPDREMYPAKVSIPDFKSALRHMIHRARQADMRPMLVTPLPVMAERYLNWISRGLDKQRILRYLGNAEYIYRWQERYDIAVREIAAETGVGIFDIRTRFLLEKHLGDAMSLDGIHPSAKGHQIIKDAVLRQLALA